MKKIKITVNVGSVGRQFLLFPSSEAAYVWLTTVDDHPDVHEGMNDVEELNLMPGEFIEAEWMGCEYAHEDGLSTRIDKVRLAKAHQPQNASGLLVSVHFGWIADCDMPFRDYVDDDITIRRLVEGDHKIDLNALFKDDEPDDE